MELLLLLLLSLLHVDKGLDGSRLGLEAMALQHRYTAYADTTASASQNMMCVMCVMCVWCV
jgi:hypothetical protein